jgi:hypothetical protein
MWHKKCICQAIIQQHIIKHNLFGGPYLNLVITGRSQYQLIVSFIVDAQDFSFVTFHIVGPPATELFWLAFVVDFRDLELTFVEYDDHEVVESSEHFELLTCVIGYDAVGRRFLVVEFHEFEVVLGAVCGDQAVHWVEVASAELFDRLDHRDAFSVVGEPAVELCHISTAQKYDTSFLAANYHEF